MGIVKPTKTAGKFITIPHWQRVWVDQHHTINFSGLVQELLTEIIRAHDPNYFEQIRPHIEPHLVRKKEIIDRLVKTKPILNIG